MQNICVRQVYNKHEMILLLRQQYNNIYGRQLLLAHSVSSYVLVADITVPLFSCCLPGSNGKYWSSDGSQVMCCADQVGEATGFQLELLGNSRIAIKTTGGQYLRGENNGVLTASGTEVVFSFCYYGEP